MSCNCKDNCDQKCGSITLPTGQDGEDAYVYIAYADDDQGNGFSTTDTTKDYISIVSTNTQETNDKSLHNNQGNGWHKWTGPSGSGGGDHTRVLYSDDTEATNSNTGSDDIFSGKSYTIPAGTVDKNGEILRIKTAFQKSASSDYGAYVHVRIYVDSNNTVYTPKVDEFIVAALDEQALLDIHFNRVDNTTASADTSFQTSRGRRFQVQNTNRFFDDQNEINTSPDFDNKDLKIEIRGRPDNSEFPIICNHLSIELVEKK